MKRIISAVSLILLMVAVFATPADAATGFTLTDGVVECSLGEGYCFGAAKAFWNNIRIEVVPGENALYGYTTEAEEVAVSEIDGSNIPYNGKIEGFFNPENGYFHGKYFINEVVRDQGWRFSGSFEKYLQPGENPVTLEVTNDEAAIQFHDGSYRDTLMEKFKYTVTFNVEGKIELNMPAPASTFPDSGARFSDLFGEVEYLLPRGLKPDGKYDYNEEAWDSCELEMVLPEGTLIRTQRNSGGIISFADMTTFVLKPDSAIILGPPSHKDKQLELLAGQLWINVKNMMKTGSMEIEGQSVVASIKGTTLVLEEDGEKSTLKVIEGTVELTSKATGESVMVETGSMLSADSQGFGDLQTFDIAAESASWPQVAAIDTGNTTSAAEPDEPNVVVLPYGAEAEEVAPDAVEASAPRIGWILGIYFAVAVSLVAAVVVIVLLTRRKKRHSPPGTYR